VTPGGFRRGTEHLGELEIDDLCGVMMKLQVYICDAIPGFTIGKKKVREEENYEQEPANKKRPREEVT